MRDLMEETKADFGDQGEWSLSYLPRYYRKLRESAYGFDEEEFDFEQFLGPILENHLVLNPQAVSREENYEDCFFAAEVRDSDLPWDVKDNETDW